MLRDTALRSQVEGDQHIAAENDVEPFLEQHPAVVTEVDAVKANARFEEIVGLEFLVTNIFEVFPAEGAARIAQGTRRKCRRVRFRANYRSNID